MTTEIKDYPYYSTNRGVCINASCEDAIKKIIGKDYRGRVQLIFTSPPFPLNRAKRYGNLSGQEYKAWLCNIGRQLIPLLNETGSIVIEIGNAWNAGEPTFSTLPIETLLEFKDKNKLFLCQEFIYFNPSRLPGPIEWVNKKRERVKDSFTRLWWLSTTAHPYACNSNVVEQYSNQMEKLLKNKKYNSGPRPSEHSIGEKSFLKNNGGAIPSNVIISANTSANDNYIKRCKESGLPIHPARMPMSIPMFFIKFLTRENDIVFDCFSGSNTTGYCAEISNRNWISTEINHDYFIGSEKRFLQKV